MSIPFTLKKNIRDFEPKRDENMAKINGLLGGGFSFDCDMESLYNESSTGWGEKLGEVVYDKYLSNLATNFAQLMSDDMIRDAFLDAVSKKKITLIVKESTAFVKSHIEDGIYHIIVRKGQFPCNFDQSGSDLEKAL